jgi:hypothetical protein
MKRRVLQVVLILLWAAGVASAGSPDLSSVDLRPNVRVHSTFDSFAPPTFRIVEATAGSMGLPVCAVETIRVLEAILGLDERVRSRPDSETLASPPVF